ncbi:hypothetical protein HK101_000731 [Irineochytrium annulatum]|nr:hypothetical protein HK101_000731 [Irineochytrium annulatum]
MTISVEILPDVDPPPSSSASAPVTGGSGFIHGYWGLGESICIRGILRIRSDCEQPVDCAPCFVLHNVQMTLEGRMFTSNGDARKHSPYESHTFLTIGPEDCVTDWPVVVDGVEVERALDSEVEEKTQSAKEKDGQERWEQEEKKQKKKGRQIVTWEQEDKMETSGKAGSNAGRVVRILQDGTVEVPFRFPISWESGSKLHASLLASDPEWGFGARVAYKLKANVRVTEGAPLELMTERIAERKKGKAVVSTSFLDLAVDPLPPPYPPTFNVTGLWRFFTEYLSNVGRTSITAERPLVLIRHSPAALLRHMKTTDVRAWSSRTDEPPESPGDANVVALLDYAFSFGPTTFGPGDDVVLKCRCRPKAGSRLKVSGISFWMEEVQGVGIELRHPKVDADDAKALGELEELMAETTLGRKYIIEEILRWEGKAESDGYFSTEREIRMRIPPLRVNLPAPTWLGLRYRGINPSGRFAHRVQIDHKIHIKINLCTMKGVPLPSLKLTPHEIFVNGYNLEEAERIVNQIPRLRRQADENAVDGTGIGAQ